MKRLKKTRQQELPIADALWGLLRRPALQVDGRITPARVPRPASSCLQCLSEQPAWIGSLDVDAIGQALRGHLSRGWDTPSLRVPTLRALFAILASLDQLLATAAQRPLVTAPPGCTPQPCNGKIRSGPAEVPCSLGRQGHERHGMGISTNKGLGSTTDTGAGTGLNMGARTKTENTNKGAGSSSSSTTSMATLVALTDLFMEEAMLFGRAISACCVSHGEGSTSTAAPPGALGGAIPGGHLGEGSGGSCPCGVSAMEQLASALVDELVRGAPEGTLTQFLLLYFCLLPDATLTLSGGTTWPASGLHPPLLLYRVLGRLMTQCSLLPGADASASMPPSRLAQAAALALGAADDGCPTHGTPRAGNGDHVQVGGGSPGALHTSCGGDGERVSDGFGCDVACMHGQTGGGDKCLHHRWHTSAAVASIRYVTGIVTRVLLASARSPPPGRQPLPGAPHHHRGSATLPRPSAHSVTTLKGDFINRAKKPSSVMPPGPPDAKWQRGGNNITMDVPPSMASPLAPGTLGAGQAQMLAWELLFALEDGLRVRRQGPVQARGMTTHVGAAVGGAGGCGPRDTPVVHSKGRESGAESSTGRSTGSESRKRCQDLPSQCLKSCTQGLHPPPPFLLPPVMLACFMEVACALDTALHTGVAGVGGVASGVVRLRRLATSVWQTYGPSMAGCQGLAGPWGQGVVQGGAARGCGGCHVAVGRTLHPAWGEFSRRFLGGSSPGFAASLADCSGASTPMNAARNTNAAPMVGGETHSLRPPAASHERTNGPSRQGTPPCADHPSGSSSACLPGQATVVAACATIGCLRACEAGDGIIWSLCASLFDHGAFRLRLSAPLLASAWAGVMHWPWEGGRERGEGSLAWATPSRAMQELTNRRAVGGPVAAAGVSKGERVGCRPVADDRKKKRAIQGIPAGGVGHGQVAGSGQESWAGAVSAVPHTGALGAASGDGDGSDGGDSGSSSSSSSSSSSDWSDDSLSSDGEHGGVRSSGRANPGTWPIKPKGSGASSCQRGLAINGAAKTGGVCVRVDSMPCGGLVVDDADAGVGTPMPANISTSSGAVPEGEVPDDGAMSRASVLAGTSTAHGRLPALGSTQGSPPCDLMAGAGSGGMDRHDIVMADAGVGGACGSSSYHEDEDVWGRHIPDDVLLLMFERVLGVQGVSLPGTQMPAQRGRTTGYELPTAAGAVSGEGPPQPGAGTGAAVQGVQMGGAQGPGGGSMDDVRNGAQLIGDPGAPSSRLPRAETSRGEGSAPVAATSGAAENTAQPVHPDNTAQPGQGNSSRQDGSSNRTAGGVAAIAAQTDTGGLREASRGLLLALARLSLVCRSWCAVACDDRLWSVAYARRFGTLPRQRPKAPGGAARAPGAAAECRGAGSPTALPIDEGEEDYDGSGGRSGRGRRKRQRPPLVKDDLIARTMVSDGLMTWRGAFVQRARLWSRHRIACTDCGMAFRTQSALREHAATHGLEYVCPWPACGRTFFTRRGMRRHEKKNHVVGEGKTC
eukprot:jgi/Mesvir1/14349/Mv09756-RA.1